jgi:hypothetical protein
VKSERLAQKLTNFVNELLNYEVRSGSKMGWMQYFGRDKAVFH